MRYFLSQELGKKDLENKRDQIIENFYRLDDSDVVVAIKEFSTYDDFILSYLSKNLMERKLLKVILGNSPSESNYMTNICAEIREKHNFLSDEELSYLVFEGKEANQAYNIWKEEIHIKLKDGTSNPISKWQEHSIQRKEIVKYFTCYPEALTQNNQTI